MWQVTSNQLSNNHLNICLSRPYPFKFLKVVFHNFYLVQSWIICPVCLSSGFHILNNHIFLKNIKYHLKFLKSCLPEISLGTFLNILSHQWWSILRKYFTFFNYFRKSLPILVIWQGFDISPETRLLSAFKSFF